MKNKINILLEDLKQKWIKLNPEIFVESKTNNKELINEIRVVSSKHLLKMPYGYDLESEIYIKNDLLNQFLKDVIKLNPIINKYYNICIKVNPNINIFKEVKDGFVKTPINMIAKLLFEILYRLYNNSDLISSYIIKKLKLNNYIIDENFINKITDNKQKHFTFLQYTKNHPEENLNEIIVRGKIIPFNSNEFGKLKQEIKDAFPNRLIDIKDWGHKETVNSSGIFNYGSYYSDYVSFNFYLKDLNKEDEEIINNIVKRYAHRWDFTDIVNKYRYQYDRIPNVWITLSKEIISAGGGPIGESFSKQWWNDTLELDEIKIKDNLNEIGELSSTFDFIEKGKDPEENILYSFKTPENEYTVAFIDLENGVYERYFNTKDGSYNTNEGIALKVISTVTKITMDFISKYQPNEISIHPIATGKDEFSFDDKDANIINIRRKNISLLLLNKNIDKSKYNIITTPRHILIKKKDVNEIKVIRKEGKIYNLDNTDLNGDEIIKSIKPGDYIQAGKILWKITDILQHNNAREYIEYEGVGFKNILFQIPIITFRDEIDIYKEGNLKPEHLFEIKIKNNV